MTKCASKKRRTYHFNMAEPLKTIDDVQLSAVKLHDLSAITSNPQKKAKLSSDAGYPRDPRLRAKTGPVSLSSSPVLHHKVSAGGGELRLGASIEGGQHGHSPLSEGEQQHVLPCEE